MLGVFVVSANPANMLRVFSSPKLGGKDKGFQLQRTLGGPESPFPMQFKFQCSYSGSLAFTGCAAARYLLVSDNGHGTVHVIDVVHGRHVGFVVAAGTIPGPRGVAAMGSLVAVSAWKAYCSGKHFIQLFEGSAATWKPMRVISGGFRHPGSANGQLEMPCGLRFAICDDDMVTSLQMFIVHMIWKNGKTDGWWLAKVQLGFSMVQASG